MVEKHRSTRNRDEVAGAHRGLRSARVSNLYMRRFVLGWKKLGHESVLERTSSTMPILGDLLSDRAEEALPRCGS